MLGRFYVWLATIVSARYRREVARLDDELARREEKIDDLQQELADLSLSLYLKTGEHRTWRNRDHDPEASFAKLKVTVLIAYMRREDWRKYCQFMRQRFGPDVALD